MSFENRKQSEKFEVFLQLKVKRRIFFFKKKTNYATYIFQFQ